MPEITVNGINLYYETFGAGDPIVFLHGFASDHLIFTEFPQQYQDYKVVLIDNRGSGQSDCPEQPYTIEMMADDIVDICSGLSLGPCHFVGHSMGGMILQQIALQHPTWVRSAVFCNSSTKIDLRFELFARSRLECMVKGVSQRALIESVLGWLFSNDYLSRPAMVEKLIKMRLENPFPISELGYRNQLHALENFDSREWVHQIKSSSLVISSDQDIVILAGSGEQLANQLPHAEYHCIKDVGHIPFLEKPKEFHSILKNFLTNH